MKLWNLYEYFVSKNVLNFIHKTVFVKMSEDFDRENYLFIIWASIYNELRDRCSTSERRLLRQQQNMHALWYSHECTPKTDTEENKMLNKVIIVSFVHKKYSRSFLKWGWTTDVTWTILMMLSGPWTWCFLGLAVNGGTESSQISSKQLIYGFGTTWQWEINDKIKQNWVN